MKMQHKPLLAGLTFGVLICATVQTATAQQMAPDAPTTTIIIGGKAVNCPTEPSNPNRLYGALIKNADTSNEVPLYEGYDYDPFDGTQYDDFAWSSGDKYRMREVIEEVMDSGDVYYKVVQGPGALKTQIVREKVDGNAAETLIIPPVVREFVKRLDQPNAPIILSGSVPARIRVLAPKWNPEKPDLPDEVSAVKAVRIYLKRFKLKDAPKDEVDVVTPGEADLDDSHDNPTPNGSGKLHLKRKTVLAVGTLDQVLDRIYSDKTPIAGRKYWYILEAVYEVTLKNGGKFRVVTPSKREKWVVK